MNNLEVLEVMKQRHSVREYLEKSIEDDKREVLNKLIQTINEENGLNIQILYDEPECFDSMMARYGKLTGVRNYISLTGPKGKGLDEKVGYYGEKIVIKAQELGLNTCWVALTRGKSKANIGTNEKEACLIAIGYGKTQGIPHKNKPLEELCVGFDTAPSWFKLGMEAALLAPTAINQQKFKLYIEDDKVKAKAGLGFYAKMDLGIVKYHFESVTGVKVY